MNRHASARPDVQRGGTDPGADAARAPEPLPAGYREYYGLSVQKKSLSVPVEPSSGEIHQAALEGTSGASRPLPHLDRIQASFGHHDVSGIRAHDDSPARAAAKQMDAQAFAVGDHVAFGGAADLHTAAHEAAHVIQQRAGVHLKANVGEAGDAYERHADAVADRVTSGASAEPLLDQMAGGAARPSVQLKPLGVPVGTDVEIEVDYRETKRPGKKFIVELPSGFPLSKRDFIAEKLGCKLDELLFINKLDDSWQQGAVGSTEKSERSMSDEQKQKQAASRITGYLERLGINELDGAKIGELLKAQVGRISFRVGSDFSLHSTAAAKANDEGQTSPGKRGEREISIDAVNHTWGSVVHEVFRALAHPNVESLPEMVVDGIVELLTRAVTGLDIRSSRDKKPLFSGEVELVTSFLNGLPPNKLAPAYFLGHIDQLEELLRQTEKAASPYLGEFKLVGQSQVPARKLLPQEKYLARQGKQFVAQLPQALSSAELGEIAQQLGCELAQIYFITVIPAQIVESGPQQSAFNYGPFRNMGGESKEEKQQGESLHLAVLRVREYLAKVGITSLDDQTIENVLAKQSKHVQFFHENDYSHGMTFFMHGYGGASPKSTEGLTKTDQPRFERPTGINIENHTWGTVVHELFHGLEHPALLKISDMMVEGMTELLTQRATGLTMRCAKSGGEIYEKNVKLLKMALDKGVITDRQIRDAYFFGQLSPGILQLHRTCEGPGKQIEPGHTLATPEEKARGFQQAERMLVPAQPISITVEELEKKFNIKRSDLKENEIYSDAETKQTYRYDGTAVFTLSNHNFTPV